MNKLIVVILVIVVAVAGVLIWDHESRVEYTVDPGVSSEMLAYGVFRRDSGAGKCVHLSVRVSPEVSPWMLGYRRFCLNVRRK